jgi:hypothetical protein
MLEIKRWIKHRSSTCQFLKFFFSIAFLRNRCKILLGKEKVCGKTLVWSIFLNISENKIGKKLEIIFYVASFNNKTLQQFAKPIDNIETDIPKSF